MRSKTLLVALAAALGISCLIDYTDGQYYPQYQPAQREPRLDENVIGALDKAIQSVNEISARFSNAAGSRQDLLSPVLPVTVIFSIIVAGAFGTYGVTQAVANLLTTTTTAKPTRTATVTLVDSAAVAGTVAGTLTLVSENGGEVKITGTVTGLAAGAHGFHVHEKGLTTNDCADAGGHFNPESKSHGRPSDSERHAGDLGNIVAFHSGTAEVSKVDDVITLGDGGTRDVAGLAIVIHSDADSWGQPTGAAGVRLACGIITLT